MLIPMQVVEKDEDLENVPNYCYLVGKKGTYVKKETFAYRVIQQMFDKSVQDVQGLVDIEEEAVIKVPNIPYKEIKVVLDFFIWAAEKHSAEAVVYMYFNPETEQYGFIPPKQEVAGASISYEKMPTAAKGFKPLGTIHSHVDMSAFHSGTDANDQATFDGIHITMGKVRGVPEYEVKLFVSGQSYDIKDFIEGAPTLQYDFPDDWKKEVSTRKVHTFHPSSASARISNFLADIKKKPKDSKVIYDALTSTYLKYNPYMGNVTVTPLSTLLPEYTIKLELWNKMNHKAKTDWLLSHITTEPEIVTGRTYGYFNEFQ